MTMTQLVDLHASVNAPGVRANQIGWEQGSLPLPAGATVISRNAPIPIISEDGKQVGLIQKVGSEDRPKQAPVYAHREPSAYADVIGVRPDVEVAQPRTQLPVPDARTVLVTPAAVVPIVQTPPKIKTKVRLSNKGMGKITTFVDGFGVSDSLVILAYVEDGTANIVEPPDCDAENPVTVEANNQTYSCMYGGWSATLDGRTLVVLVRIPN